MHTTSPLTLEAQMLRMLLSDKNIVGEEADLKALLYFKNNLNKSQSWEIFC